MEEIYRLIEDKIKNSGYNGPVSGEEIYEEIYGWIMNHMSK